VRCSLYPVASTMHGADDAWTVGGSGQADRGGRAQDCPDLSYSRLRSNRRHAARPRRGALTPVQALQAEAAVATRHAAQMMAAVRAAQRAEELARRAAPGQGSISRPVAVQSLASCGAKQRGHSNNDDGPYRPLGDAADCGSALDKAPGTASRARSELEIPASAGGFGRSRRCVAHDGQGHQPSVVPSEAAIAMPHGDDRTRDARRKGRVSDRSSMHGSQGHDPRSLGAEGAAPSLESLVAIFNDARRSLVGQTGEFSLAQGQMVLTVLGIAGPRVLPSPRQLRAMRNCLGGCGDARAFDSLLVSTVRILQGGNGLMVSPVDTAARLVQGALEAHACSSACQPPPCSASSAAAAVRHPAPPPAEPSSAGHRSPVARSPSPPHKRFRECAFEEEDRREMRWVPAAAGRARPKPPSVARSRMVSTRLLPPPRPNGPRLLFSRAGTHHVELFSGDMSSLADGSPVSPRIFDAMLLWLLHRHGSEGRFGGLRVLTSLDAADVSAAGGGDRALMDQDCHVVHQRLVFSADTVLIPVRYGRLWWGIVVRSLDHMVQVVVEAERHGRALVGAADRDSPLVVVNTSSVGIGTGGWDERVVDQLFIVLAITICGPILRTFHSPGTLTRVLETPRRLAPVDVIKTSRGNHNDSAERLLLFFTLLQSATPGFARALLRNHRGRGCGKAHAPRRRRGLVRRVVEAHRPGNDSFDEEEPAEELMNGRELFEDESESTHTMEYHDSEDGEAGGRDGFGGSGTGGFGRSGGGSGSLSQGSARGSRSGGSEMRRQEGSSRSSFGDERRCAEGEHDSADGAHGADRLRGAVATARHRGEDGDGNDVASGRTRDVHVPVRLDSAAADERQSGEGAGAHDAEGALQRDRGGRHGGDRSHH